MKRVGVLLICLFGLLASLAMLAGVAYEFYVLFDWRFALIVVPVGALAAMLAAGAINWWSERYRLALGASKLPSRLQSLCHTRRRLSPRDTGSWRVPIPDDWRVPAGKRDKAHLKTRRVRPLL